jgi:hypothetical protein
MPMHPEAHHHNLPLLQAPPTLKLLVDVSSLVPWRRVSLTLPTLPRLRILISITRIAVYSS